MAAVIIISIPFIVSFLTAERIQRPVDLSDFRRAQMYFRRAAVLNHALHFSGAGDRDDPRLLSHKPRQRDLRRCSVLLRRFGLN